MQTVGRGGVFGAGGIQFGETVMEGFELLFHFMEVGEDAHAFGENGAAGEGEAVLRKIALGDALGDADLAVVEGFEAAEDFEERGFTGTVGAYQAGAFFGRNQPVALFEEKFVAETFAGALELDHLFTGRRCTRVHADAYNHFTRSLNP